MSETPAAAVTPKPKKSVALSGVTAGNTALCTVGRQGNDLHYRGYDILDFAETAEFEEVAYLLVHGKLPTAAELHGIQAEAQGAARPARGRAGHPGMHPGQHPSDGRAAHRLLGAGLGAARAPRITRSPRPATSPIG